jgi:hypothetical protein
MQVTVRRKYWDLRFEELDEVRGLCDPPDSIGKTIRIDSRLAGEEQLEVICHEVGHASFWMIDEESIEEFGRDIAKILWRLGYRRIDKDV